MLIIGQKDADTYLEQDRINEMLDQFGQVGDEELVCQQWLRQSSAKRLIYQKLYGDLLCISGSQHVLDVGGGLTALTRVLADRHDYELVELLAHETDHSMVGDMIAKAGRNFLHICDWHKLLDESTYDLVIANDLFPNVDQRLELFLESFLPRTRSIRLSLTYYDTPRYYFTRRINADEIFCMLAWNHSHLRHVLERFEQRIVGCGLNAFESAGASLYNNGRQVCLLEMKGDLKT